MAARFWLFPQYAENPRICVTSQVQDCHLLALSMLGTKVAVFNILGWFRMRAYESRPRLR
jgi:hypothetical protein